MTTTIQSEYRNLPLDCLSESSMNPRRSFDEAALTEAIKARIVSHATLDVFATEPLPPDHPFWENPQITITPHVCGPLVPEDVVPHFLANYAAFSSGAPLANVIDLDRQY